MRSGDNSTAIVIIGNRASSFPGRLRPFQWLIIAATAALSASNWEVSAAAQWPREYDDGFHIEREDETPWRDLRIDVSTHGHAVSAATTPEAFELRFHIMSKLPRWIPQLTRGAEILNTKPTHGNNAERFESREIREYLADRVDLTQPSVIVLLPSSPVLSEAPPPHATYDQTLLAPPEGPQHFAMPPTR